MNGLDGKPSHPLPRSPNDTMSGGIKTGPRPGFAPESTGGVKRA